MPIKLVDMAHYGRHDSYDERSYPIWWFDRESGTPIFVDDLMRKTGVEDASQIDYEALEYVGIIPFFQVDILSLKREYVDKYFDPKEKKALLSLCGEEFDLSFNEAIDKIDSYRDWRRDWYLYELNALEKEAIKWARRNRIRYEE